VGSPATEGCPREADVLGGLPWDHELLQHVASCPDCSELAELAAWLCEERNEALAEASVPDSGQMWWRLRLRARRDAARAAAAPVRTAQGIAVACVLLVIVVGGWFAMDRLVELFPRAWTPGSPLVTRALILGAATALVLAPVAVWLALTER